MQQRSHWGLAGLGLLYELMCSDGVNQKVPLWWMWMGLPPPLYSLSAIL